VGHNLIAQVWAISEQRLPSLAARLVLVRMAQTAIDDDDWPVYFAGWDTLALALGLEDNTGPRAERKVGRAIAELVEAGLIKPDGYAPGGNRRYRLTY